MKILGDFINWTTFLCSIIVATIISLATFFVDIRRHKQDVITQSITANRINWISDVRNLISEFLFAYIDGRPKNDLVKLLGKIRLYFHNESAYYQDFFAFMGQCCNEPYSDERADDLDGVVNKRGARWQYNEFGQQRRRKRHFWRSA